MSRKFLTSHQVRLDHKLLFDILCVIFYFISGALRSSGLYERGAKKKPLLKKRHQNAQQWKHASDQAKMLNMILWSSLLAKIQDAMCGINLALSIHQQTPSQQWSMVVVVCCGDALPQRRLVTLSNCMNGAKVVETYCNRLKAVIAEKSGSIKY